ncbi:Cl- channel voltage-gated family protein [Streptomyces agglomeratus]|uniref:Cl-channel voltage-gated family protein n=2 Tax=Streptomyces agglomeratus TaxID=285458 RepID=A0A1E5P1F2_9ACTN|nr:chloride channel protein [Streptomyces agglomeratus]OEJ23339.1 Cl- channel voltage-gated family protein [Streptomyces agglomeratus]OEJ55154.1 Cl- channel voltage-gated family protein [Streptomyces agglomeratus]
MPMSAEGSVDAPQGTPPDPCALVRNRGYIGLLVMAAVLGVPISAAAYGFLALVNELQPWIYADLPKALGFQATPPWWPLPLLGVAGLLVGATIRYLPGIGGHKPAEGLSTTGAPKSRDLPGIFVAAVATLALGAVLGPEAPLVALGSGTTVWLVRLLKPDLPERAGAVVGAAGSFAAVSTLLGSPITGAFLLMEASGIGGPMLGVVLVPGLLAAGIGSLVFIGLDSWTGLGTYSLAIQDVPHANTPTGAEFGWAIVIGLAAALLGTGIRRLALLLQPRVERRLIPATVLVGLVIAGLAIAYAEGTGKGATEVLYSGQTALGPVLANSADYTVGTLTLLVACKGLAYCASLSAFRGGPIFPAMFLGAAGGIALSHLPGLELTPAVAMGIGGMSVAMLRLPLTSVLLATLLLGWQGITVMPLVIVTVVVTYVVVIRLSPDPTDRFKTGAREDPT